MNVKLIKATWGMNGPLEEQFAKIAEAGYSGMEAPPLFMADRDRFSKLLAEYSLDFIAQVVTLGGADEWNKHLVTFREQMQLAIDMGAKLVSCHSAKDSMNFDDQCRFYEEALVIEQQYGIVVAHETHRGRAFYTPWTTASMLSKFPELSITADISHWLCVCESYLEDQEANLDLAAQRTRHIHGRVGYPEGPQVPHPGAPEYQKELEIHTAFWNKVYQYRLKDNAPSLTITTEFGPPGYMHTLPFTNQPVADLWEVCSWMKHYIEDNMKD